MNFQLNRLAAAATATATARSAARLTLTLTLGLGVMVLAGCLHDDDVPEPNTLAADITQQGVTVYAATATGSGATAATQDLLTGGLGKTGLGLGTAPAYADPLNPTALELRRNAIYSNYRALVDATAGGGYGTLYGPNVDVAGLIGPAPSGVR